jgi:hypothetical protein
MELLLAALLTFVAFRSLWFMYMPLSDPLDASHGELAPIVLAVTAPVAASFWLTGIALLRNWRFRWIAHAVPPVVIVCIALVLRWLDRAGM